MQLRSFILSVFMLIASFANASKQYPYERNVVRYRLSFAPVVGFYKNHQYHTINNKALPGFIGSFKVEWFSGKRSNLMGGIDFYSQGFTFRGYYSAPGNTYEFDQTYAYTHTVSIQEVNMPLLIKTTFISEPDYYVSSYFAGGIVPRYILRSYNLIVNDSTGVTMLDGKGKVDFEHSIGDLPLIPPVKKLNGFIYLGVGAQYNFRGSAKALFFELTYKYGLSRFNYHGYNNSNDLYIRNSNLSFNFGIRF